MIPEFRVNISNHDYLIKLNPEKENSQYQIGSRKFSISILANNFDKEAGLEQIRVLVDHAFKKNPSDLQQFELFLKELIQVNEMSASEKQKKVSKLVNSPTSNTRESSSIPLAPPPSAPSAPPLLAASTKDKLVGDAAKSAPIKSHGNELEEIFKKRRSQWASEVIEDKIWLGSGTDASNLKALESRKIKYVLNVADDVPNYHTKDISYLNLNVQDFGQDAGISRVFDDAFNFIQEALNKKERVLIHCAAGANRSATIVIAWLMKSQNWTLAEAWQHLVEKRPGIVPLKDNRLQLLAYERTLFNGKSSFANNDAFLKM